MNNKRMTFGLHGCSISVSLLFLCCCQIIPIQSFHYMKYNTFNTFNNFNNLNNLHSKTKSKPSPSTLPKSWVIPSRSSLTSSTSSSSSSSSEQETNSPASSSISSMPPQLATQEEIISFANDTGVVLSLSTLGPGFRAIARPKHNTTQILGYCTGFIRPSGSILHLDKMEVFKKGLELARSEYPDFRNGGTPFGIGLLIGCLCVRYGHDQNCKIAEFLAIEDSEFQHKRLVRHYKRLGLNVIRYVGEDISNIPDRMVWGGVGTLMNADIVTLLTKWSPTFLKK